MTKLNEIRCANCKKKLAEYDFPEGQLRIVCYRPHCGTLNILVIEDREKVELEFTEINLTQNRRNAL
jgi:phage FluMu protein Com